MATTNPRLAILGAGLIGCYLGGRLQASGQCVTLVGRPALREELAEHGLKTSDMNGQDWFVAPNDVRAETDGSALADAQIILLTVKSHDTLRAAEQIAASAPPNVTVVSLQNGIRNSQTLRSQLPQQNVIAAIVPFNVVREAPGHFHCATAGSIIVESCAGREGAVVESLRASQLDVHVTRDIQGVLWGKLLMNLNNSINALAGVPLQQQLSDRGGHPAENGRTRAFQAVGSLRSKNETFVLSK